METLSTYTTDLVVGDVVLDYGAEARITWIKESNTPGTWLLALDHSGNDLALRSSAVSREATAVWEVVTSARTVHVGDVVRIGNGAVAHEVVGFADDGRVRLLSGDRRNTVEVARLVIVAEAQRDASQPVSEVKTTRANPPLVAELRTRAQQCHANAQVTGNADRRDMYERFADLFIRAADELARVAD